MFVFTSALLQQVESQAVSSNDLICVCGCMHLSDWRCVCVQAVECYSWVANTIIVRYAGAKQSDMNEEINWPISGV